MDFVVVGLGIGALAVLLGLILRGGRGRWRSNREGQPLPAAVDRRRAIGRARRAGGAVLSVAGAVVLAVTIVALLLGLSDRVGAIVVMLAVTVTALGGIAWAILYTHRYHPRPRTRSAWERRGQDPERRQDEPPSLAGTIDAGVARLDAAPVADGSSLDPVAPTNSDHQSISDRATTPEQAPTAIDLAVTEPAGSAATGASAPTAPATAPAMDQPAPAAGPDPAPPDELSEDTAPAPTTVSVAAGSNRRA